MRAVKQTVNDYDPTARHLVFGDEEGRAGTLITCLEYPQLDRGTVGVGTTHHFALAVETEEELHAWRDYLGAQGVSATEVLDRTWFKSLYVRDPDGHIVELATVGPGIDPD
jgi:glyoxalase family protein